MNRNLKKHLGYYISLLVILFLGLFLTLYASPNIILQSFLIFLTIIFYVIWGILHHYINHELTSKIVVEYVLIGTLGIAILFFIFMGKAI